MSTSLHPAASDGRRLAAAPAANGAPAAQTRPTDGKIRSRVFTKYVALFVAVVAIALLSNGIFEVFFYYREHKASLIRIRSGAWSWIRSARHATAATPRQRTSPTKSVR